MMAADLFASWRRMGEILLEGRIVLPQSPGVIVTM
jgi:hypothetical protein